MNLTNVLLAIALMTAITFLTRVLPFLFFRKQQPPEIVLFVGRYIPPVLLTILVIYCLKDIKWSQSPHGFNEIIAVSTVVILHLKFRNTLISIFAATLLYMFLIQSAVLTKLV